MTLASDLRLFNPVQAAKQRCPIPREYAQLRTDAPVLYVEALDLYLVARHDLVCEVVRDPATFSSSTVRFNMPKLREEYVQVRAVIAEGLPRPATLLSADPPAHTRYRRFVAKALSPRAVADLEPLVRSITTNLIDGFVRERQIEFVSRFALPLPMEVIASVLSIPSDRLADAKRWSDDAVVAFGTAPSLAVRLAGQRGINEFQRFFAELLEERRRHPQDDLLTRLLHVRIDDDDLEDDEARALTLPEMLSIVHSLLTGGNETTTKLLAELVRRLADRPDLWARVREDPSTIPVVVEEGLRFASPAMGSWRVTTHDVELGGVHIPEGSMVIPLLGSANHDEAVFHDGDAFDPDRDNLVEHMAFGKGPHFCPGAALTRLEARVALEELSSRIPAVALADTNDFACSESYLLRGLVKLDLDLSVAPA